MGLEKCKDVVRRLAKAGDLFEQLFFFLKVLENSTLDKSIITLEKGVSKGDSRDVK